MWTGTTTFHESEPQEGGGVASIPSQHPEMAVDSNRGQRRKSPDEPDASEMEASLGIMARVAESGGDDGQINSMMYAIVTAQREHVLMQVRASGQENPSPVEEPFTWEVEDDWAYAPAWDLVYHDDVSGKPRPAKLTEAARSEEIDFVDKIQLWEVCPRPAGTKVIGTRWVDTNKGDTQLPRR